MENWPEWLKQLVGGVREKVAPPIPEIDSPLVQDTLFALAGGPFQAIEKTPPRLRWNETEGAFRPIHRTPSASREIRSRQQNVSNSKNSSDATIDWSLLEDLRAQGAELARSFGIRR